MKTTITLGQAGRMVIPKHIRESLGLREGSRLCLEASSGRFEATPEPDEIQITKPGGFPVIRGGPSRQKGDIVRAIREARAERDERIVTSRQSQ